MSVSGEAQENPALEAEIDAMAEMPTHWTCRDGRVVPIAEMGDSHLVNTIRYLERNRETIVFREVLRMGRMCSTFSGDGAMDAADMALDELLDEEYEDALSMCVPEYPALVAERDRRGIAP
jgi:hypothetical protein